MTIQIQQLLEHIDLCPLRCQDGKILKPKTTTNADILAWLQKLVSMKDSIKRISVLDIRNRSILALTSYGNEKC